MESSAGRSTRSRRLPHAHDPGGRSRSSWSFDRELRMSATRNAARLEISTRQPRTFDAPRLPDGHRAPVSSYFGRHVLDLIKLREKLPREIYNALLSTLKHNTPLTREVADSVASVARDWAVSH